MALARVSWWAGMFSPMATAKVLTPVASCNVAAPVGGAGYVPVADGKGNFDDGVGGFVLVHPTDDGVRKLDIVQVIPFHEFFQPEAELFSSTASD